MIDLERAVLAVLLTVSSAIFNYLGMFGTERQIFSIFDLILWLLIGILGSYILLTVVISSSTVLRERFL